MNVINAPGIILAGVMAAALSLPAAASADQGGQSGHRELKGVVIEKAAPWPSRRMTVRRINSMKAVPSATAMSHRRSETK